LRAIVPSAWQQFGNKTHVIECCQMYCEDSESNWNGKLNAWIPQGCERT
jgi:hypothetical protein